MKAACTTVLLVSDNETDIHEVKTHLNKTMGRSCRLLHSSHVHTSVSFFENEAQKIDVVLLNIDSVATDTPLQIFLKMRAVVSGIPIIVFTEREDHELALAVVEEGAADNVTRGQFSTDPYKLRDAIQFALARNRISRSSAKQNASDLKDLGDQGAANIKGMQEHEATARKEAKAEAGVVLKQAVDDGNANLRDAGRTAAVTLKAATEYGAQNVRDATEHGVQNLKAAKAEAVATLKEAGEQSAGRHKILEDASQAKSEFLATMSHGLRTPLNSIIGMTRILYQEKTLNDEHRDMVGVVYRSANNLLGIVNDILDLSKVESGKLIFEDMVFYLQEVVENTMETVLPLCSEKGLTFTCNQDEKSETYYMGDPLRLGRVMMNLLSNAVKYTQKGSVTVDVTCRPAADGVAMIEFSVTDTGIGIPANKLELIFEKFVQADSSITRRFGGTGLGLAITKEIVERMGGKIGVESEEGKGSRFWFRVGLKTADIRPTIDKRLFRGEDYIRLPGEQRKDIQQIQVLIAEDYLLNQAFLQKLLPRMGIKHYDIVDNGKTAVEASARKAYDMILMDCHMPIMSGYDAATKIRDREKSKGGHVTIIAMTADAMIGTRQRCLAVGMDDYISKPVNPDELRHILARWVTFPDEAAENIGTRTAAVFDLAGLRQFTDSQGELRGLIDLFLTQAEASLRNLKENCGAGENHDWTEAAHKLKGGAGMLKAEKLTVLCQQAEEMKTGSAEDRGRILMDIRAAYEAVKTGLMTA